MSSTDVVRVYLSRRNLLTLLSKLDRAKDGDHTYLTIVKYDTAHPKYPQTHDTIVVTAVEDGEYYNRLPGAVHYKDDPQVGYNETQSNPQD